MRACRLFCLGPKEQTMTMDSEIEAMTAITKALEPLEDDVRSRVLKWAVSRFGNGSKIHSLHGNSIDAPHSVQQQAEYTDLFESSLELAEFFATCDPKTDAQKALVVASWLQFMNGLSEWTSQEVNHELKDLGHGIGNITRAFDNLKGTRPQLIVQTRKDGTTKQARKKFKVTNEGKKRVQAMSSAQPDTDQ